MTPHPSPLTCAVTGANGYVGGVLLRSLRAQGHRVLALQRLRGGQTPGKETRHYSLTEPLTPGLLTGVDVLVHCAYDFSGVAWRDIEHANVQGTLRLFEAARNAGVRRILFISSVSSFEGCRSHYGRAKLAVEHRCAEFGAVIVRPGVVYGPGAQGMMGSLAKMVRLPVTPMVGSGRQQLLLVHEEDLGHAVASLAARGDVPVGVPIFAAAATPVSLKELMRMTAQAKGRSPIFLPIPWRLIWLALKAAEACGLRPRTRSDSLVALVHANPAPDMSHTASLGLVFREPVVADLR